MLAELEEISMYYEKRGEGAPLIMVHGNSEDHTIFEKAVPLLEKNFTVYLPDLRGHGQSSPVSEYHYTDMAEDIRYFVEHLQLEDVAYYGYSDGGIIGLITASRYPELFSKMIISGANLTPEDLLPVWLERFKRAYEKRKDPRYKMMIEEPHITTEMLHKIMIPTCVLAGENDIVSEEHTRFIAEHIKNSFCRILPGEEHGTYIEGSTKIAELLLEWME